MQKTKIDWADYTWNPVVGCKHGCPYCYAERINRRFQLIPNWKKPKFFHSRLYDPDKVKKPSKIFVGSMCDLFGKWVPKEWIMSVINTCEGNPHHTFMFLTKNPQRYSEFEFPKNCWLGATLTGEPSCKDWPNDLKRDVMGNLYGLKNKTFISIEPLLGPFYGHLYTYVDLVIVGAMTGANAVKPKKEWIDSIKHPNIFYKDNIKKYLPENTG